MKVCKSCGSSDVAQAVWLHYNAVAIQPIENIKFSWCFKCCCHQDVVEHTDFVKKTIVTTTTIEQVKVVTPSKSGNCIGTVIDRKGFLVRSWHLIKNAKKKELKGCEVEWHRQKGNKVPVWIKLKDHKVKTKKQTK